MSGRTNITDFTQGNVTGQLLRFATPLFLSSLLQIVYNMADMVIVGRALGKVGLSAVSVGGDVTSFLTFLALGFSAAGQVIISQMVGAGETKKTGRFIGTMFSFMAGCAIVVSAVCLCLRIPILKIMHTPEESFSEALAYATVCMTGLVFIYGYNMVSAVLRGMGDSLRPFLFIGIAAVMNMVLDIVLVLYCGMGSRGAAIATVCSQAFSFLCCSIYILHNRDKYRMHLSRRDFLHPDKEMLVRLVKLGIPMAVKSASVQFSKLFVNSWINSYGVAVSAFAGIANKINATTILISTSFNTAGASMVGQNIGARKYKRVRSIMLAVYRIMLTAASLQTVFLLLFSRQFFEFFTDDSEVIQIGMQYIPIGCLIFFGCCARSGMNALINGSGNTKANFATAILDGIVLRIGLAVLFGLVLDMRHLGFWLGDALAGFTPFWIGLVFYFRGTWKKAPD